MNFKRRVFISIYKDFPRKSLKCGYFIVDISYSQNAYLN